MTTEELAERQRVNDIAHHRKRVAWLSSESPKWADGQAVSDRDRGYYLRQSLSAIENPCEGTNSCHCANGMR